jgi:hypothetical protein
MMDACIETFTGVMFNLLNPTIDMITIEDIAHSGSQLCRFTGHTRFHYSIAQHELLGSYLVPEKNALEFLLHDASESFVNDMSRPLKHMTAMGSLYRPIEENIQILVRQKYGLPAVQSPIIHTVDNMMLLTEKRQLMGKADWSKMGIKSWEINTAVAADISILEMSPREVEQKFLTRFRELTKIKEI